MKGAALLKLFLCLFLLYDIIVNFRTFMNYHTMLQPWEAAAFFHFLSFCQHWLNHSIHCCKKKKRGREQQFRHLHCALLHTFSQALQALPLRNAVVSKMYTRDQKCAGQWCCQKKKNFLAQPDHLNPTNLLQCLQLQVGTAVLTFRLHAKALRKFFSFFVPLGCILLNTGAHSEQQLWFRHAPHLSSLQPEWSVNVFVSWECSRQRGKRKKEPEVLLWRLCHCQWLSTSAPK